MNMVLRFHHEKSPSRRGQPEKHITYSLPLGNTDKSLGSFPSSFSNIPMTCATRVTELICNTTVLNPTFESCSLLGHQFKHSPDLKWLRPALACHLRGSSNETRQWFHSPCCWRSMDGLWLCPMISSSSGQRLTKEEICQVFWVFFLLPADLRHTWQYYHFCWAMLN